MKGVEAMCYLDKGPFHLDAWVDEAAHNQKLLGFGRSRNLLSCSADSWNDRKTPGVLPEATGSNRDQTGILHTGADGRTDLVNEILPI